MRTITAGKIKHAVARLAVQANTALRKDVLAALKTASRREKNPRQRKLLEAIIANAGIARRRKLAICQDTGLPVVFLELGARARIKGDLKAAVLRGIKEGYQKSYFRNSVVLNPLLRSGSSYSGAVMHLDIVPGSSLKVTLMPKGFGCENKAQLKMFNPTAGIEEIKKFVIEAVKSAGPDACPPYALGVGIGGTADYACFLAKKALLKSLGVSPGRLERALIKKINQLNIGPMGLGGKTTCLGVNILTHPTHIAGLPVAVNLSCHALRSASKTL